MQLKTMYPAAVNSKATVTMGALDANTTTVTVLDGTVLPDAPNILVLGTDQTAETVLMTAKEGNVLTIERGFQGTPKAWNAGTEIARNFTGYDLDTVSENIEAVAEQAEETANLVNGVQFYKSLPELSATASTDLLTIFAAMATPSRLVCDIANGNTAVYPAASGTLCINKTGADTGTASFIYEDGRVATATFTANSSGGGTALTNWNRLTERVESMCNPNLLINTDFRNPVNQRGQTSYTGVGYGIDYWKMSSSSGIVNVKGEVVIPAGYQTLRQEIETPSILSGKTVTVSAVVEGVRGNPKLQISYNSSFQMEALQDGIVTSKTVTLPDEVQSLSVSFKNENAQGGEVVAFKPIAIKLELGAFSTLANEVVDYATELKKCQRYLQVIPAYNTFRASYVDNSVFKFNIPIGGMRINPSLSGSIVICGIDNAVQVDFIMSAYTTDNMIIIVANKNSHGLKDAIFATGDKSAILSAEP